MLSVNPARPCSGPPPHARTSRNQICAAQAEKQMRQIFEEQSMINFKAFKYTKILAHLGKNTKMLYWQSLYTNTFNDKSRARIAMVGVNDFGRGNAVPRVQHALNAVEERRHADYVANSPPCSSADTRTEGVPLVLRVNSFELSFDLLVTSVTTSVDLQSRRCVEGPPNQTQRPRAAYRRSIPFDALLRHAVQMLYDQSSQSTRSFVNQAFTAGQCRSTRQSRRSSQSS